MTNPFTAHPSSVNETYWEHLRFALRFGTRMTQGGIAALVHALLPFCFVTTAGRISDELVEMRAAARGRSILIVDSATMLPVDYSI